MGVVVYGKIDRMSIGILVYGHILMRIKSNKWGHSLIVFANLKSEELARGTLDRADIKTINEYFNNESLKYGVVDDGGMIHLFSDTKHIAIHLNDVIPSHMRLYFDKIFVQRFIPKHMILTFPLELYRLIEQFTC